MKEIWNDIIGYEGLYKVSNLGFIKSLSRSVTGRDFKVKKYNNERILKPSPYSNGYLGITLCKNGISKQFILHRIIAIHFIPNPKNFSEINHKDENKTNNCINNLEWCSHKYNANYGTKIKRTIESFKKNGSVSGKNNSMFGRKGADNPKSKPVIQLTLLGKKISEYPSIRIASKKKNVNPASICAVCKGKLMTCGGFKWKYK